MNPSRTARIARDSGNGDARGLAIVGGGVLLLALVSVHARNPASTAIPAATTVSGARSATDAVDVPGPAEVEAAMMEVARYDGAAPASFPRGEARARLQEAVRVLGRDRSFGAQVRRQWASALLPKAWQPAATPEGPSSDPSDTLEMPQWFSKAPTGLECCVDAFQCSLYEDPDHRGATVRFGMAVYRPYLDVAAVLDPQNWKDIDHAFDGSGYLQNPSCPTTDSPDLALAPAGPPTLERDAAFHEHFSALLPVAEPPARVAFDNVLRIRAHHHPASMSYAMSYGLCPAPGGSISATLPTGFGPANGKLALDDGFANVMDASQQSGDTPERASFLACKAFALTDEFYDRVESQLGAVKRGLPLSLEVFAVQTRIAVCKGMTEVVPDADCSVPVDCEPGTPPEGKTYDQVCS